MYLQFFLIVFLLGASCGSFINVVVDRVHRGESINGRSYCEGCKRNLRWFELVPVFSYFFLKGSCPSCKTHIPVRLPVIELLAGVLALFPVIRFGFTAQALLLIVSGMILLYIGLWDYLYMEIPTDGIVLLWATGLSFYGFYAPLYILSGLSIIALFLVTYIVSRGNALGFGDVLLVFSVSSLLSLPFLFLGVYFGVVCGGIIAAILLILRKVHRKSHIPFGPFLVLGFYVMLFYSLITAI